MPPPAQSFHVAIHIFLQGCYKEDLAMPCTERAWEWEKGAGGDLNAP